uniref:ShKT domain-containing protein n=1 Tax=Steinernema glaseri TaxID=37863 RepID=A0A1I8AU08_9BILA
MDVAQTKMVPPFDYLRFLYPGKAEQTELIQYLRWPWPFFFTLDIMQVQIVSAIALVCFALGASADTRRSHQNHLSQETFAALACIGGLCPSGYDCVKDVCVVQCKDVAPDCVAKAYLCSNSLYYDLMTKQCAKTCGRCGSVTPAPNCADNAPGNECQQKAYLCNNSLYYDLMTKECRKTCGRC